MGKLVLPLEADIRANGKIAQLIRSPKKPYVCLDCRIPTGIGEPHYTVTYGGSGLGSIKFPNRICLGCLPSHMGIEKSRQERYEDWGRFFDWCSENKDELEKTGRMEGAVRALQKIWSDLERIKGLDQSPQI